MQFSPFAVRVAVIGFGLVLFASSSRADTVYLKNGAYIDGFVTARSSKLITIKIGDIGKLDVKLVDVVRVEKNSRTGSSLNRPVDMRELPDIIREKNSQADEAEDEDYDEDEDEDEDAASDTEDEDEIDAELKAKIEALVKDLQRQKTKYRRRAERKLDKIGPPAVPFLLPLVTRGGDLTRITALRLISFHAKEANPETVETCLTALKDANYFVRDYAVKTLRRLAKQHFEFDARAAARSRRRAVSKWQRWWEMEQAGDGRDEADDGEAKTDEDDGKKKKKKKRRKKKVDKADGEDDEEQ